MKYLILFLNLTILYFTMHGQPINQPIKTALIVIDIQEFYFPSESSPGLTGAIAASEKAKEVIETFRKENQLIIHVRHKAENGFDFHKNVTPLPTEKVITKSEINAFKGTDLLDYLKNNNINRLILIGMQTHMCLEAATRAGHDYDFKCFVIEDACATRDLKHKNTLIDASSVHYSTLATLAGGGYAKIFNLDYFNSNIDKILYKTIE